MLEWFRRSLKTEPLGMVLDEFEGKQGSKYVRHEQQEQVDISCSPSEHRHLLRRTGAWPRPHLSRAKSQSTPSNTGPSCVNSRKEFMSTNGLQSELVKRRPSLRPSRYDSHKAERTRKADRWFLALELHIVELAATDFALSVSGFWTRQQSREYSGFL
jgi:hypothetical protein